MLAPCPYISTHEKPSSDERNVVRLGRFRRKSDGRWIQRFTCKDCGRGFSHATRSDCYRQNKRQLNDKLRKLFASGLSQRRLAKLFGISRTTVARKFEFLGTRAFNDIRQTRPIEPLIEILEFDDMESFEHSKLKPVSIAIAVENKTRRILDLEVAQMPAKGPLAARSIKKYGPRKDERTQARARLFQRLTERVSPFALLKSDMNPQYPATVKKFFPLAEHQKFKGRRGCVIGQGELKRGGFDPLFSFNHTAASFRANVNRLFRRTWNTTKKRERLAAHMAIYAQYHNNELI